jgi:hypothetical protein
MQSHGQIEPGFSREVTPFFIERAGCRIHRGVIAMGGLRHIWLRRAKCGDSSTALRFGRDDGFYLWVYLLKY